MRALIFTLLACFCACAPEIVELLPDRGATLAEDAAAPIELDATSSDVDVLDAASEDMGVTSLDADAPDAGLRFPTRD